MVEERICYVSQLPLGGVILDDVYTNNGALLCRCNTVIDQSLIHRLSSYKNKIKVNIDVPDSNMDDSEVDVVYELESEEDTSIAFSDTLKEYALDSVSAIYDNLDEPDTIVDAATQFSSNISDIVSNSESLSANLSSLKVSDEYTYKHSVDVGTLASILARRLNKPMSFVQDVGMAGILHDIGKSKIPDEILNKCGKLTDEEFNVMKQHPVHGYKMLTQCDIKDEIKLGVLNHHENFDGTGYPRRLSSNDIGDMGKILAIVDVFDALVSKRVYKPEKTPAQALEIMFTMSNKFDLKYFRTFLSTVIAYPNGSFVDLSTGERCKVIKQNESFPLRPVVCNEKNEMIDLSMDLKYLSAVIL